MNFENQKSLTENFTINNLSTSGSTRQFIDLIQKKSNYTQLSRTWSRNWWSHWLSSQLPNHINNSLDYLTNCFFFGLDFILFYFYILLDFVKSFQSQFINENYFESITTKFEFKVFVLLVFIVLILLVQIFVASKYFKENIEYYNKNHQLFQKPSNLNYGKTKAHKPKSN